MTKNHRTINRRHFLAASGTVAATLPFFGSSALHGKSRQPHVVIVGGGFAGASAARYLRHELADVAITLIEPKKNYVTCPFSNYVIAGFRTMDSITWNYDAMKRDDIRVIHQRARDLDSDKKKITLADGSVLSWDFIVLAGGIDFIWDAIEGYGEKVSPLAPHAWQAGEQTLLLQKQLRSMEDGGLVVLTAPENPYRCPPAPYERASVIAHYLTHHKPRSKVIILDQKNSFTKQKLFEEGWKKLYGDRITWVSAKEGGSITAFDPSTMTIHTAGAGSFKASVANIVPPHHAAALPYNAQLADKSGWCPIDAYSMESTIAPDVYIIGDSILGGAMPKSGFSANSQGKASAKHIASRLNNSPLIEPLFMNTCYSLLSPDYGISVAGVYRSAGQGITAISGAGGVSPLDASVGFRKKEALYADGWYQSITSEMFL